MAVIFDLDDTLFDEMSFVMSGFRAVAAYGEEVWRLDAECSFEQMSRILGQTGRGAVFDDWLRENKMYSRERKARALSVYRSHNPSIELFAAAEAVLTALPESTKLFIVTDGNKLVQANKVSALDLWHRFAGVYITHRHGLKAAKPSTYCFEKIRERVGEDWSQMVYIGDNPNKDFVSLRPLGMQTVRVLTGSHRNVSVPEPMDAEYSIPDLSTLLDLPLRALEG